MDITNREYVLYRRYWLLLVAALTLVVAILVSPVVLILWGPLLVVSAWWWFSWRPFCLANVGDEPAIGIIRSFRWRWIRSSEITGLRYEILGPGLRRGGQLQADLQDGSVFRLPGVVGRLFWRSAVEIPSGPCPRRGLHLVRTLRMLALIEQRLSHSIQLGDVNLMEPNRRGLGAQTPPEH